jgi:hypothetical protein
MAEHGERVVDGSSHETFGKFVHEKYQFGCEAMAALASRAPCDRDARPFVTSADAVYAAVPLTISLLEPHMLHTFLLSFALATRLVALPQNPDSLRPDLDVRLVALRHAGEIQRCYENQGLKVNPGLGGMIEVEVTVAPSGRVEDANVSASALSGIGRQEVESCITTTVKNWRFERGPYTTETIVYPFNLVRDAGVMRNTRA